MKKLLLIPVLLFMFQNSFGQRIKIAYIDMEYILEKLPEYQSAQKELENKAKKWKANIEKDAKEIADLKEALEQEKVLLTKELLQEKEEEIAFKEKELLKYQLEKFGPEGDYILQKQRLVTPVQDRVFNAVTKLIKSAKYDIVFDKSNDKLGLIYTSNKMDISDKILKLISKKRKDEERKEANKSRKEKQKKTLNEAQKKRAELAAKRKNEREEKRKKEIEERKKKSVKKTEEVKKDEKKDVEKTDSNKSDKNEDEKKASEDDKNEKYGTKLTPEQLKKMQESAPKKLTKKEKAALRKKEREERRKRILEERKKNKNK